MEANVCGSREVKLSFSRRPLIMNDTPVYVRNASKSFWQRNIENSVLKDLNLSVSLGKIYGLLGPSGCGKTTLLRCIIGRLSLDKGQVLTFGETPGTLNSTIPGPRLGYMPQEDALDGVMSIKEILYYYGCLLCVPKKRILEKITFLVNFLKLPSEKRRFSSLSGGQKRRVSFAVALIHDAELLILDEPTVGVDQILKHNIWNYLCELVESGKKTVIITTHYIEEARRANNVGMMFEGRLLAEGEPDHLISMYLKTTLEDVFLCVCADQKNGDNRLKGQGEEQHDVEACASLVPLLVIDKERLKVEEDVKFLGSQCEAPIASSFSYEIFCPDVHLNRCQAVIYRGFIQLFRYPGLLLLLMATPAFLVAVCGFALGRPVFSIQIGVTNEDTGEAANKFLPHIDSKVISQTYFASWEDAQQSVRDGQTWGALNIGKNFSTALFDRYSNIRDVDRETVFDSNIIVSLDGTNFVFVETIRYVLLDAFKKFVSEFMIENNLDPKLAHMPIVMDDPVFSSREVPYGAYIMPSMITTSMFFSQMGLAIITLYLDKEDGKLERIYITGVTTCEIIFGFIVIQMSLMVAEAVGMLFVSFVVFKFANEGSFVLIAALTMLQGMCGTTFGLVIAASANKFTTTTILSVTMVVMSVALGGLYWPLQSLETTVRYVCLSSPIALPANALRNIMFRSWNLSHPEVWIGFAISFIWTLVFLTLSVIFLRVKKTH